MPEFGCQESQLVTCRIALRHTGLRVVAEHTGTTAGRFARLSSVSELCVNVFGRDVLLAAKPNNDSLVVLHPLNEKPETDGPCDHNSKLTADVMPL
jgi:hypothetical protein